MSRQRELQFQNHIIDSYALAGGHAKKWATEWQGGNPDLICALPGRGLHLAEVKHITSFNKDGTAKNPLRPKQKQVCRVFRDAGAPVLAYIVVGDGTVGSTLYAIDPQADVFSASHPAAVQYARGAKYDVVSLLSKWDALL